MITTRMNSSFENPAEAPISINSATDMLKAIVRPNDRPYDQVVKKANNALVDSWKTSVLAHLADEKGVMAAGKVWPSWEVFIEGHNLKNFDEMSKHLIHLSDNQLDFWLTFFDNLSLEELCEYGPGVSDIGWYYIQNEVRIRMSQEKWKRVYSHSDDPLDWEKTKAEDRQYLRGEIFPFWSKRKLFDAEQKIKSATKCQARQFAHLIKEMTDRGMTDVSKAKIISWMEQPIHKNDRPYTQTAHKYINNMINEWASIAMTEDEYQLTECQSLWDSWVIYNEGLGLKRYETVRKHVPRPSEEIVQYWLEFFRKEIDEIHSYGTGYIGSGWFLLQNENKIRVAELKLKKVFVGDDLKQWIENAKKENDLMVGNEGSLWTMEELRENGLKVGTVLSLIVAPQSTGPRI